MEFIIKRRWFSSLPPIKIEIGAEFENATEGMKLGAAIKILVGKQKARERGADLSGAVLRDADLSGAVLRDADLSDAVLSDAVLRGADLRGAVLRGAVLRGAVLRDAVLRGADLSGAVLRGAVLRGAVLSDAVLRDADLRDADLRDADLSGAVLRGADLSGVPVIPKIDAAILAAIEAGGRLDMTDWHGCGTTHCRAGWAITLAGEAGAKLEETVGPATAGVLIYHASTPNEPTPDFYCDAETALADIKARAAKQNEAAA